MKTKTITPLLTLLFAGLIISGCQKWEPVHGVRGAGPMVQRTYHVRTFDGLQVDVNARVNIVQAAQAPVVVRGQQNIHDILEVRVINGVLLISYKTQVWRHDRLEIDVSVPELSLVSSFGSAEIRFIQPFTADDLHLDVLGSGKISARQLAAKDIRARINGSGTISLQGVTLSQQVNINGSGDYFAGELLAQDAIVNIFGSGNCNIHVNTRLHAAIHGSGSLYYTGNPNKVETSVLGSGKVVKLQ